MLIKHFVTIDAVKNASVEEIRESGMPQELSEAIYSHFHSSDE